VYLPYGGGDRVGGGDFLSSDVQKALFARFIIVIIIAINTVRQHPRAG